MMRWFAIHDDDHDQDHDHDHDIVDDDDDEHYDDIDDDVDDNDDIDDDDNEQVEKEDARRWSAEVYARQIKNLTFGDPAKNRANLFLLFWMFYLIGILERYRLPVFKKVSLDINTVRKGARKIAAP